MNLIKDLETKLNSLDVGEPLSKKELILSMYPYIDKNTTTAFNRLFYLASSSIPDKKFKSERNIVIRRTL